MKIKILILTIIVCLGSFGLYGQTIVTVGGGADITCPTTPAATWTTTPAGVTFSNWSRGSGVTCDTAGDGLSGSGFNTTDSAASFTANKFYSVTLIAAATHSFTLNNVVWNTAISTGAANFTVQYVNNGGTRTTLGTAAQTNTTSNTFAAGSAVTVADGTSIVLYLIPAGIAALGTTVSWVNGSSISVTTSALPNIALSDNGTQVGASNVNQGIANHILHKFQLGVTNANASLTGLSCATAGNYLATDITNLKVRYSADAILDAGDATLSTFTNPGVASAKTFPSFTAQAITAGTIGYVFITADVAASATHNNTINVNAITTANVTVASGNKTGSTAIGGVQTIKDVTAPTVTTLSPLDNATNVAITSNLVLTFNENVVKGTGNILIKRVSGDAIERTIAVGSTDVTVANNVVTINPPSDLLNNVAYYVEIPAGAFEDLAGNDYTGISGNALWNFTITSATTDYFRTKNGGEWSLAINWESSSDNTTWNIASLAPTSAASSITIQNEHIITFGTASGTVTADDLTINSNGMLAISGGTFILNNGAASIDLQVNGNLTYTSGTLTTAGSGIAFGANSLYNHSIPAATLTLPIATWDTTSTCNVTGMNNTSALTLGAGSIGQTFGNFIWNNMNQVNVVNIANSSFAVAGTLTVGSQANSRLSFANATGTFTNAINSIVVLGGQLNCVGASANVTVNVANNVIVSGGLINISGGSGTATLNVNGNLTVSGGKLDVKTGTNSAGNLNLKGNLAVASGAEIVSTVSGAGTLNFTGTTLQTVNAANATTTQGINFNVKSGASVQLINQDLALGTNAAFKIETGGTFDFGFNGTTALNVVSVASQINQRFEFLSGSTLKITSPFGITQATASATAGNIQTPLAGRVTNSDATLHYIGKANQVAGNLLVSPLLGKVIVEMDTDALSFSASDNETFSTGAGLEIRKGIVVDTSTNSFGQASGKSALLTMSGGRYSISKTGTQPSFTGASITGGVIEFASSQTTAETIRNLSYQNIEVTGNNVGNSTGNITLEDGGTFAVKSGGIFSINDNSIIGPAGTQTVTVEDGGIFKTGDPQGFNDTNTTSIRNNIENIILAPGSTVEYAGNQTSPTTQTITPASYSNLTISGTGTKTLASTTEVLVGDKLKVTAGTLQIDSNKLLTVTNAIENSSVNPILIANSGSLVQITNVANASGNLNTGNIKMTRTSRAMRDNDYIYWGSPVKVTSLSQIPTNFDATYQWDLDGTINGSWKALTAVVPGRGFITKVSPTGGVTNFDFTGVPNNGTISIAADAFDNLGTDVTGNSILLANPYPSAIDAASFISGNPIIGGTLYFWTSATANTGSSYAQNDYASWNGTGSTGNESIIPSGKIAAGQGFFALLKGDGVVNFTNAIRVRTTGDNTQFFKTTAATKTNTEKSRVWLNITNDKNAFRQMLVGYIADATNGIDNLFDGTSFTGNEINIYSIAEDKNLVIQGRALPFQDTDIVPLGVAITKAGTYTISIDKADGLLTNAAIFLEDKATNLLHNLKSSGYSFNAVAGTFNARFILRYNDKTLGTNEVNIADNSVLVSVKDKQIKVNSANENINTITVYDLLGRQLFQKEKVNSPEFILSNLIAKQEVLFLKVLLQSGKVVSKKVVF